MYWHRRVLLLAALVGLVAASQALAGCGKSKQSNGSACSGGGGGEAGAGAESTRILQDYTATASFFAAPFPDDARRDDAGHPKLDAFPNPAGSSWLGGVKNLLERDANGFSTTAGVFFALDGALDPAVAEDYTASIDPSANAFLMDVDPASKERGRRWPVSVSFSADGGRFGHENLLALVPLQGAPLHPLTRYAAVVLRAVRDIAGEPLGAPDALTAIIGGRIPDGMSSDVYSEHRDTLSALAAQGISADQVAGLAVFTTDEPTAGLVSLRATMLAEPLPSASTFTASDVLPEFCVYASELSVPVYQSGTPPFASSGGNILFTDGKPTLQGHETARVVVTVPRATMPSTGFPIVLMPRAGGEGDRPLVDRGAQGETGGPALTPGSGPALYFARAGYAAASFDGPLGGLRDTMQQDEQFLVVNWQNPAALRDNFRQAAAELSLEAHALSNLTLDGSACPGLDSGGGLVYFDTTPLPIFGHDIGAEQAALALAVEPAFNAGVLSGARASFIERVLDQTRPTQPAALLALLLGDPSNSLDRSHPALSLLQWALEPADPSVYGAYVLAPQGGGNPRHVLMIEGVVDHYAPAGSQNALSLALGLDLAGTARDPSLGPLLTFSNASTVALPAQGNRQLGSSAATAVVTQTAEDGIEDGHEVLFQSDEPKHAYRCFLDSLKSGVPSVPAAAAADAPCN